jgi:hypothetical protein
MQSRNFDQTKNEEKVIRNCYPHWIPHVLKAEY